MMSATTNTVTQTPRKKAKAKHVNIDISLPCYITTIPFELIAEVLSHTSSPRDVLALARCNKYFCATLVVNQSSVFIWRQARARAKPEAIPDPLPYLSEPAYAALIFDKGDCDFCECPSKDMYASFALKIRLCRKASCRVAFRQSLQHDSSLHLKWLPYVESSHCHDLHGMPSFYANNGGFPQEFRYYSRNDFANALDQYNKARRSPIAFDEFIASKLTAEDKLPGYMVMCFNLYNWKVKWEETRKTVKRLNESKARRFAEEKGWTAWDLVNTTCYKDLHHRKISVLEEISDIEFRAIQSQIESELIKIKERRDNRAEEHAYQSRRQKIEEYYNKLKAEKKFKALPILSEFRKLPVIKTLQSTVAAIDHSDLQNDFVAALLKDDLDIWLTEMQTAFSAKLGHPDWKTESSHKLHPVYRLSSLFMCTECDRKPPQHQTLTFESACTHRCPEGNRKRKDKQVWKSERFIPHDKAKKTIEHFATLQGIDLESESSLKHPALLTIHVLCLSCPASIVMRYSSIVAHSGRHEEMRMTTLDQAQVTEIVKHPIEYGLTDQLRGAGYGAKKDRDAVIYACRHCHQVRDQPALIEEHTSGSEAGTKRRNGKMKKPSSSKQKFFSFHGLRSHLKEKHGVEHIADEDYYRTVES